MSIDDERPGRVALIATTTDAVETTDASDAEVDQRLYLNDGRQVAIIRDGARQAVEIRAASGQLELRIRLTEDGPVLSLDAVKVELRATDVAVECETFAVTASQRVTIASAGTAELKADGQLDVSSADDVNVIGKNIRLN